MSDENGLSDELSPLRRQIAVFAELSTAFEIQPVERFYEHVISTVCQQLHLTRCMLWRPVAEGDGLVLVAHSGWADGVDGKTTIEGDSNYHLIQAYQSRKLHTSDELHQEPDNCEPDILQQLSLHSVIHAPIIGADENIYGVLSAYDSRPSAFDQDKVAFFTAICGLMARAIAHNNDKQRLNSMHSRLKDRLRQVDALNQEIKTFTQLLVHDLTIPLRIIVGYADVLMEDYGDTIGKDAGFFLKRMKSSSDEAMDMLDDLRALADLSKDELQRQTVDLSAIVDSIRNEYQEKYPDRAAVWGIDHGLKANGDRYLLRLALEHLLDNAWKFTSMQEYAEIEFGLMESNGQHVFFVRDNGVGFDMKHADRLFTPFQRLHGGEDFEGRGLGLAATRRVIYLHGGQIWVESEVGYGATFYFTLPNQEPVGTFDEDKSSL